MKKAVRNMTTLCYIEKDDNYLMMHRVSKKNDVNHDKWIGVGGHFEDGESPEECLLREVREETGFSLISWKFRGIVTFRSDDQNCEYMHLYTAAVSDADTASLPDCPEGILEWVPKDEVKNLPIWEGDKIFFRLMDENHPFFSLKLTYRKDKLVEAVLDGTQDLLS